MPWIVLLLVPAAILIGLTINWWSFHDVTRQVARLSAEHPGARVWGVSYQKRRRVLVIDDRSVSVVKLHGQTVLSAPRRDVEVTPISVQVGSWPRAGLRLHWPGRHDVVLAVLVQQPFHRSQGQALQIKQAIETGPRPAP